jgi:thiol-disulfide isomerase/thioredoxin
MKYKNKYNGLKMKNMKGGDANKNTLYLFKADWCGHCRGFKPTWQQLQDELGEQLEFVTFDAEKDKNKITEYNIQGFPTLILKKGNEAMEYVGSRDKDSLKDFINKYSN